jgi:hypothetical protein
MYHCYLRGHVDMHNSSVKEGPRKKERQRKKERKKASVICMRALKKGEALKHYEREHGERCIETVHNSM